MVDVVSAKLGIDYVKTDIVKEMYLESLLLYFDKDDRLKESTFRQVTPISHNEVFSYPLLINELAKDGKVDIGWYTNKKFQRINSFLINIDRREANVDIDE